MNSDYIPPVGALVYFNFPGCGYGIVVAKNRTVNENGHRVVVTHILWQSNAWTEVEDFSIRQPDPFWQVILPQLPPSTVAHARAVWQRLVAEYERREEEPESVEQDQQAPRLM